MTIEGLGKKFQEARLARNLTLDQAARMTKIRPSRLAEIEADDFSQFPSLAYAKGFLLIYGKFLDVDVTPYMEAFETSEQVTVDGYSYLQESPSTAARAPVVRRRPPRPSTPSGFSRERPSFMPLIIGVIVIVVGFWLGKLVVNLRRLSPPPATQSAATTPSQAPAPTASMIVPRAVPVVRNSPATQPSTAPRPAIAAAASVAPTLPPAPSLAPTPAMTPAVAEAVPSTAPSEPEVRRAEPVSQEDLAKARNEQSSGPNDVVIRPLKKTYVRVVVDDKPTPVFERWISPSDGAVEFHGQKFAVRVLDRDAIQIKKNGRTLDESGDEDVKVE
jgi:cytoskeleton protein RodZ